MILLGQSYNYGTAATGRDQWCRSVGRGGCDIREQKDEDAVITLPVTQIHIVEDLCGLTAEKGLHSTAWPFGEFVFCFVLFWGLFVWGLVYIL